MCMQHCPLHVEFRTPLIIFAALSLTLYSLVAQIFYVADASRSSRNSPHLHTQTESAILTYTHTHTHTRPFFCCLAVSAERRNSLKHTLSAAQLCVIAVFCSARVSVCAYSFLVRVVTRALKAVSVPPSSSAHIHTHTHTHPHTQTEAYAPQDGSG